MIVSHNSASGMGGIRTAGDMVFRMQLQKMKINDAKKYVADKLRVSSLDLSDCAVMKDLREELNIGCVVMSPDAGLGIQTKFRIEELLDVPINSVANFRRQARV